ncbi:MAG: hypothetical protein OXC07_09010 [Kistimonas sp.]|nr:hypothetical protein [Kistimonas sp.]
MQLNFYIEEQEKLQRALQKERAIINGQKITIEQLRLTVEALQVEQMESMASRWVSRRAATTRPAASSSSTGAQQSIREHRLEEARGLFAQMQRNPNISDSDLRAVLTFFKGQLTGEPALQAQLQKQIDSVTDFLATNGGCFSAYEKQHCEAHPLPGKVELVLAMFSSKFYWSNDLASKKKTADQWMLLLEGFNVNGCTKATDILVGALGDLAKECAAWQH